jgi:hypothetical protein
LRLLYVVLPPILIAAGVVTGFLAAFLDFFEERLFFVFAALAALLLALGFLPRQIVHQNKRKKLP